MLKVGYYVVIVNQVKKNSMSYYNCGHRGPLSQDTHNPDAYSIGAVQKCVCAGWIISWSSQRSIEFLIACNKSLARTFLMYRAGYACKLLGLKFYLWVRVRLGSRLLLPSQLKTTDNFRDRLFIYGHSDCLALWRLGYLDLWLFGILL